MIPGVRRAILILGPVTDGAVASAACWPSNQLDMALLAEAGKLAQQRKAAVVQPQSAANAEHSNGPAIVACPLFQDEQLFGVVVLEVETLDEQQQHTLLQLLQWGSAWLQLLPQDDDAPAIAARLATVIEITAKSLEPPSLQAAATAVITHLAQMFACDRVSFGLLKGRHMRVHALSHSAQIDRRSELIRRIEAAMDEALDEGTTLSHPPSAEDAQGLPAHERLCASRERRRVHPVAQHRRQGDRRVDFRTLPGSAVRQCDNRCLRSDRSPDRPGIRDETPAGSLTAGQGRRRPKRRAGQTLRAKSAVAQTGSRGLLGLVIWLSLATTTYRISATAVLEGTEQRALVAPIDGYVEQARARAGEFVKQGDLMPHSTIAI